MDHRLPSLFALVALVALVGCASPAEPCSPAVQLEAREGGSGLVPGETAAGIEQCGDAFSWNRVSAEACATDPPTPLCDRSGGSCTEDDDCAAGERCLNDSEGGCGCREFCSSDADCNSGEACVCTAAVFTTTPEDGEFTALQNSSRCVPADCRTNEDCGVDGECGIGVSLPCGAVTHLRCRGAGDGCRTSADCSDGRQCGTDAFGDGDAWTCVAPGTCG